MILHNASNDQIIGTDRVIEGSLRWDRAKKWPGQLYNSLPKIKDCLLVELRTEDMMVMSGLFEPVV